MFTLLNFIIFATVLFTVLSSTYCKGVGPKPQAKNPLEGFGEKPGVGKDPAVECRRYLEIEKGIEDWCRAEIRRRRKEAALAGRAQTQERELRFLKGELRKMQASLGKVKK